MMRKSLFVLIVLLASGLQAQEFESVNSEMLDQNKESKLDVKEASPQMSLAYEESEAPGVCLVISDMLAGFCQSNPSDISCQSQ